MGPSLKSMPLSAFFAGPHRRRAALTKSRRREAKDPQQPRQQRPFEDYRYFIYITNDWQSTPEEIVFSAHDRCGSLLPIPPPARPRGRGIGSKGR
jgi:hypothetical protein